MYERKTAAEGIIAGKNPVMEILKSSNPVDKVYMQKDIANNGIMLKIKALAIEKDAPVKEVTQQKLNELCGDLNHQGVAAVGAVCNFVTIDDLFAVAQEKGEKLFVILCDDIEDPHNLGALIRTADACGAHGVIIPKRHGVGMTGAVMRSSAGAAGHVAVARVPNLASAIDELKKKNVWIYAADMDGENWCSVNFEGNCCLVVGSEGKGVSRLVKEKSDVVVSLPMMGKINSLNASVAGGILMYEIARQRLGLKSF